MATIAVLGATGRTGRILVDRARAHGHHVTAIVRQTAHWAHVPGTTLLTADPCAPGALTGLLDDQDAVISALGATGRGPTTVYSAGTAEIIAAMPPAGRVLVISSAGLSAPDAVGRGTRLLTGALQRVMRHTYADMARMENLLASSVLCWTAVRPTGLTDAPASSRLRDPFDPDTTVRARTSRTDLADYLLAAVDDPRTYGTAVAFSS